MKTFGEYICERRTAAGMSQAELSRILGIAPSMICAVEAGKERRLAARHWPTLARALPGVTIEQLEDMGSLKSSLECRLNKAEAQLVKVRAELAVARNAIYAYAANLWSRRDADVSLAVWRQDDGMHTAIYWRVNEGGARLDVKFQHRGLSLADALEIADNWWKMHMFTKGGPNVPDARTVTTRASGAVDIDMEVSVCVWDRTDQRARVSVWDDGIGDYSVVFTHLEECGVHRCVRGSRVAELGGAVGVAERWWAEHEATKAVSA